MSYNRNCRGFTLVEMAVVLVIIGLLVGSFIGTVSSRIETSRYAETRKDLEDIKLALIGYAYKNGGLPCPDFFTSDDGVSDVACVAFTQPTGNVPWVTLGLGSGDPWNNRYEYWVDASNFSDAAAVPFDLDTDANGQVSRRSADGTALELLASGVVAVIYSRGKNGLGAEGVDGSSRASIPGTGHSDEELNADTGANREKFVSRPVTPGNVATDGGTFDDIVIWISEYELKAKMVEAGVLP